MGPQPTVATARDRLLDGLPLERRQLDIGGVATSVLEGGKGRPVILLHGGIQAAGTVWWRTAAGLTQRYRVVVPDLPGLGGSEPTEQLDAGVVTEWLAALLRLTCHEPATLVAHSAPASLAARFAATNDELLRQLVLVDSAGLGRFRPSPAFLAALVGFNLRPSVSSFQRFMSKVVGDLDATRAHDSRWPAFADYIVSLASDPHVKRTMRQLIKAGTRRLSEEDLDRITVPATLIWGRDDPLIPLRHGQDIAEQRGWPLHAIDGAGHLPHLERPDEFVRTLVDVIEGP